MRLKERDGLALQNEGSANTISCSSFIQNMSCRPRTTVRSAGLTLSKIPERLKGENFIIDFRDFVPVSLTRYAEHNPGMSVPIFNALLTFGRNRRHLSVYERFIKSGADHEQSLMKWVLRAPEEVGAHDKEPARGPVYHGARQPRRLHPRQEPSAQSYIDRAPA
ncbi:MAG: hypothetical protein AMJ54_16985 [Deltaproteobacteria bacterium SG8_13]|nr:MAG: hypothetical protein AMJ54_16985 [Deltaproteobacteria bacterium SG8_13]